MDERVWEKTAQFLKELRCEDTGRLSQLQLPEYQKAMKEKFSYQPIYEQIVSEMTDEQRCVIEKYVGLTEQCAEAVSYTHLRAHETRHDLVCRLLLEKKKKTKKKNKT